VAGAAYAVRDRRALLGVAFFAAAAAYWRALVWVDRHGQWPP